MPNFLLETFPKVLSIKSWSSSLHFTSWNILSKTLLFRNMSLFLRGGWVVKFLTLSHFCHMSLLGGGGWVLKEIWSMSLNNPGFFWSASLSYCIFVITKICGNIGDKKWWNIDEIWDERLGVTTCVQIIEIYGYYLFTFR